MKRRVEGAAELPETGCILQKLAAPELAPIRKRPRRLKSAALADPEGPARSRDRAEVSI